MRKILLIATGGTVASKYTEEGLAPKIQAEDLLRYIPDYEQFCIVSAIQPFSLDSTNVYSKHWKVLGKLISEEYHNYDGFVICHGTDTMAYTAASLSYMIQNSLKPIVITGAQRPIDIPDTDARTNLLDSLRFCSDSRAHGVNIVFGGRVIAGTRAKKERTKSYNAFSSINYPDIAVIQNSKIAFYIDDKETVKEPVAFYLQLNEKLLLLKLIPGMDAGVLREVYDSYDGIIIESFGVGGLPDYGDVSYMTELQSWIEAGKIIVMATQVTHEGSDMAVYRVGRMIKDNLELMEAYDMTLAATVTKTMWAMAYADNVKEFKELFYKTVNHDILLA